nr:LamG-like jellyroll fold domain-containing protein [uncultured Carboxylicivirga sp.]
MNMKNLALKVFLSICFFSTFYMAHAQEMGVNFNESLFHAEDVEKIARTKTTWVRGFFDFFSYYSDQNKLTDPTDQLEDFLNLQDAGFKTILNIKWNFHTKSYPDTTSTEIAAYNDFLQSFLDRVWGKIDIIVVGNEPYIESMNNDEKNNRLPAFYQYMLNRVNEYRSGKENIPIYFGAFNKLYYESWRIPGVLAMLDFVKENPWIEGIDIHIHHQYLTEIPAMYSYANDRIRDDQKILMTEFSLVFWWQAYTGTTIPSSFATQYGYSQTMKVYEYIRYALNSRRPKAEWDNFLSQCSWFEDRKNYLWEVYEILSQYKSFNVATYSYQISWGTNFDETTVPWLLNNLIAAVTIEDDPETGDNQFNYAFIDDFYKIQEASANTVDEPLQPLDPTKMFMQFEFDDNLTDGSPQNTEFILNNGTEQYNDGKFGKALHFNNNSYVTAQNALINVGAESSTLGVWVKMDQPTSIANAAMTILHQKDPDEGTPPGRIMMEILSGDYPSSFESALRVQSTETIEAGIWYHITIVHDADKGIKSIYVNGKLKGVADFGTEQSVGPFVMGSFKTEERAFLYGSLDELFWTREILTPDQIKLVMEVGINKSFEEQSTDIALSDFDPGSKLFFPNPTSGNIEFSNEIVSEKGQYQLFDINGRAVTSLKSINKGNINLSSLQKGIYLVRVLSNQKVYTDRLILSN